MSHSVTPVKGICNLYEGSKIALAWERLQVELHGQYSVKRLHDVLVYYENNKHRQAQTIGVLVFTPLLALSIVLLLDLLPMNPPSEGSLRNWVFWLRTFLSRTVSGTCVVLLFSQLTPVLPITMTRVIAIALVTSIAGTGSVFVLSLIIGFPVPFSQMISMPAFFLSLYLGLKLQWKTALQTNPSARPVLVKSTKALLIQGILLVVYPAYNNIFLKLSGTQQAFFSLMLQIIKICAKNLMSRYLDHMEDLRPEIVTLSVEMFSSLFTVFSMQNATSMLTTIALILADAVHSILAIYDTARLIREIEDIRKDLTAAGTEQQGQHFADIDESNVLSCINFLMTRKEAEISSRIASYFSRSSICPDPAGSPEQKKPWRVIKVRQSEPNLSGAMIGSPGCIQSPRQDNQQKISLGATTIGETSTLEQRYIQKTLKLLHLTEFIVLIEYTEVVIPTVYCIYLLAMSKMPNRVYYPNLANIDDQKLDQTIASVMLYSILELLSFIGINFLLKRHVQLSPTIQAAFVLEKQWIMVQSKFVLCLVFLVQASVVHFGVDYTLRFEWLHNNDADHKP